MTQETLEVLTERRDDVWWVTLNRPRAANAINGAMADRFVAAFAVAAADPDARALVLTGSGIRVFCAGVDIRDDEGLAAEAVGQQRSRNLRACVFALLDFRKPVVAAVNGVASGGGCMLALLADRLVATHEAAFAMPEISLGAPTYLGLALLAGLGGEALANDLVQSGRRMPAAEAAARGLVAEVVAHDALAGAAQQAAMDLAAKPATAFALNKAWINARRREALQAAMDLRDRMRT